jgi:hypothetical protein
MGAGGTDVLLSAAARAHLPIAIECKSHARYAIYKDYAQSSANAEGLEPVLVIKQNHSKPLAVIDLEYFLGLLKERV